MLRTNPLLCALITLALSAIPSLRAADVEGGTDEAGPRVHAASNEGENAIARFHVPAGLKVDLFAAEPLLANPVSLRVDNQGRVYVAEAFRRGSGGVLDVRNHTTWVEDDLASQSVADRIALLKRKFGPNVRKLRSETDQVQLLEDTKGTGRADKSTVFADGFNAIEDGIAASVLPRDGNVYLTDIPSLYLLRDTTGSGKADQRKVLSTGYGVHISYRGHDMHGLRMGPDGKIYFSIGDRAANAVSAVDGSKVTNTDSGAVFRCNPDGSELELFAFGLRNPQQLVFDQYGNLFTGDNNPDYGDPARWVYVVENGDSGWRIGYQLDRTPVPGGQWMDEQLWQTQPKLHAAYIVPPVAHLGAGPSGVAYYPGTGMSEHWNEHLFMCDFRGSPANSGVHSFKAKPLGAGFELEDEEKFFWGCLVTDIDFSTVGGAYVSDWVQGWNGPGKGRIYRVFDPEAAHAPIVAQTRQLLAAGMAHRSPPELIKLLAHPDMRVRMEAQFALAGRGAQSIQLLTDAAAKNQSRLARLHAIWALGQIGRKAPTALPPLLALCGDGDDEVRAQSAKVLGEDRMPAAPAALVKLLKDPAARVRFFAAQSLGRLADRQAVTPLLDMLKENADQDGWLRHAGVMGLVGSGDVDALLAAAKDPSPSVRMGVLLALRRLHRPEIAQFLADTDASIVLEAARAIYDVPIAPALPALAQLADHPGLDRLVLERCIGANFRLGSAASAEALVQIALRKDVPDRWRVEALDDLSQWQNPPALDRLLHAYRPLPPRDVKPAQQSISPALTSILKDAPDSVRVAAVALIEKLKLNDPNIFNTLATGPDFSTPVRQQALEAMARQGDPRLGAAIDLALKSDDQALRATAIRCMGKLPDRSPQLLSLASTGSIPVRQAAYAAMGEIQTPAIEAALAESMTKLMSGEIDPELRLDVVDAAAAHPSNQALAAKLQQYQQAQQKVDALGPYRDALVGGDAQNGRKIFRERVEVSCIRCHTAQGEGGVVGPKLDGIASRQPREYLLESIVFPNAKIAAGYESIVIKKTDGSSVSGIVKKEDAKKIQLIAPDGGKIEVAKSDVRSREHGLSAMPEGLANNISRRDLRDLVEFLASLQAKTAKR